MFHMALQEELLRYKRKRRDCNVGDNAFKVGLRNELELWFTNWEGHFKQREWMLELKHRSRKMWKDYRYLFIVQSDWNRIHRRNSREKSWERYSRKQPREPEARLLSCGQSGSLPQNFLLFFNIRNKKIMKKQPPSQVCTLVIFWVSFLTGEG